MYSVRGILEVIASEYPVLRTDLDLTLPPSPACMFVAHQVRRKAAQRQGSNTKMTQKEQATRSKQVDKAVLFACLMPEFVSWGRKPCGT